MDFFDNVISKTKDAIDVVSKKTGEIVTVEKQKFDAASLKAKLEKDYAELGRLYFKSIDDTAELDEKTKAVVNEINKKIATINELNVEIANAKNKRFCPACKASIPDTAVFCSNCGERVIIED
ncbi:MAG: zinc ribbon domain-containing protein [Clostridia bacterium]|nr:zinc ribbon domain-containing protein [Clostridia bacterium]